MISNDMSKDILFDCCLHVCHVSILLKMSVSVEQLISLYHQSVEDFEMEFDMSSDGSSQKTFHQKYDAALYSIALLLMYSQLTTTPAAITLYKHDGHNLYYEQKRIYNGGSFVSLTSFQNIALQTMIKDQPERLYLFNNCTVLPDDLTSKTILSLNTTMNTLLAKFNPSFSIKMYKDVPLTKELLQYFVETNRVNSIAYHRVKDENTQLKRDVTVLRENIIKLEKQTMS